MRFILSLSLCAVLVICLSFEGTGNDVCTGVDEGFLKKHLPVQSVTILSKQPKFGFCEVIIRLGGRLMPLYAGKDFIISGNVFRDGRSESTGTITKVRKELFEKNRTVMDQVVAFSFTPPGTVKRVVYMFTDPFCPFCSSTGRKLREIAGASGVEIKYILIPVNGPRSKEKCIEAICRGIGEKEYASVEWKKAKPGEKDLCSRGKVITRLADTLSDDLGITGVPAFYLDEGSYFSGDEYPEMERILTGKPGDMKSSRREDVK